MKLPKPRQLKNGKWIVRVRVGGHDVSKVFPTEKEAEAWGIDQKLHPPVVKPNAEKTVRQLLDGYIESNDFAPGTVETYDAVKTHFRGFMDKPYKDVNNWQAVVSMEKLHPNTIASYWGKICAVLRFYGLDVPTVKIKHKPSKKKEYLTESEIRKFCEAIKGHRFEFFYLMMLSSCRLNEALSITEADRAADGIHVHGTKTEASDRFIPYLFPRLKELPIPKKAGENTLRRDLAEICKSNDLPPLTPHGLRVSFASACYHAGNIPERVAMKIGGWQSMKVFHDVYVRIAEDDVTRYAAEIRKAFE